MPGVRGYIRNLRRQIATGLGAQTALTPPSKGWVPTEGILVGAGLAFLLIGLIFPWWGFTFFRFDQVRGSGFADSFQFNPWLATRTKTTSFPGGFDIDAFPGLWWDFAATHPTYAAYGGSLAALWGLWTASVLFVLFVLVARGVPRRRYRGLPTIVEGLAGLLVAVAIAYVYLAFPSTGAFSGFSGHQQVDSVLTTWGPGVGWYAALVSPAFLVAAAGIGFRVDRRLRGVCWFCFKPVSGPSCAACGKRQ